jgi:serine/threonine protein phosphatase PrpC
VQGRRAGMEDEHIAIRPLFVNREGTANLFGVFDGHGGKTVAVFLRENMPHALSCSVQSAMTSRTSVERALKEAFLQVTPLSSRMSLKP